jgi:hypothetical protein
MEGDVRYDNGSAWERRRKISSGAWVRDRDLQISERLEPHELGRLMNTNSATAIASLLAKFSTVEQRASTSTNHLIPPSSVLAACLSSMTR